MITFYTLGRFLNSEFYLLLSVLENAQTMCKYIGLSPLVSSCAMLPLTTVLALTVKLSLPHQLRQLPLTCTATAGSETCLRSHLEQLRNLLGQLALVGTNL